MPCGRVSARSGRGQIFPFAAAAGFTTIALRANSEPFTLRQRIKRVPWSFLSALEFNQSGAGMEDDMAVDTAVDAELWLIFAAMIGWIVLGCFLTAHDRHHAPGH